MPKQSTLQTAVALKNANSVEGQDIQNVCEQDGKIYARIDWLRLWPKNPRVIDDKNYKKLKKQIEELGIYKPLVITPDGEILGGNQRYKAIKELSQKDERYKWVWVSIVEAWTDEERLKYALSDNFSAGEYTREKLKEVINAEQSSLFTNYDIEFTQKESINQFIDQLGCTEEEIKFKNIKKELGKMGVTEETLETLGALVENNRINEKLDDVDIQGKITGQKFPLLFWLEDETLYAQLEKIFETDYKQKHNTEKLIEILESHYETKFPTDENTLLSLLQKAEKAEQQIADHKEMGGDWQKIEQKHQSNRDYIHKLFAKLYPNNYTYEV